MKVSILINNYNYGRYVGEAIDSALAQTWHDCEVIVVDDGSTDESWRVIESYGSRIRAVRQDNAGQGAAYNRLWSLARGDAVLFLDADDTLDHDAIVQCVAAADAGVSSVQFRLRLVDTAGRVLPGSIPYVMHDGDVAPIVRRFVHYAGPPGSGNFYVAKAIAPVFPLEAARWPRAADTMPFIGAAFAGNIRALQKELGSYRLHRHGALAAGLFGNIDASYAAALAISEHRRNGALQMLRERFGIELPGPFLLPPNVVRTRALSWRLDRARHPFADDSAWRLIRMQLSCLRHWPRYTLLERLTLACWALLIATLPEASARRLAPTGNSPAIKTWIRLRRAQNIAKQEAEDEAAERAARRLDGGRLDSRLDGRAEGNADSRTTGVVP